MRFEDHKVIPVIKINDANKAEALARALLDGGIAAVEITLRTEAGLRAIKRIADGVPEMTVGAGSVLDKAQADVWRPRRHCGPGFAIAFFGHQRIFGKARLF